MFVVLFFKINSIQCAEVEEKSNAEFVLKGSDYDTDYRYLT